MSDSRSRYRDAILTGFLSAVHAGRPCPWCEAPTTYVWPYAQHIETCIAGEVVGGNLVRLVDKDFRKVWDSIFRKSKTTPTSESEPKETTRDDYSKGWNAAVDAAVGILSEPTEMRYANQARLSLLKKVKELVSKVPRPEHIGPDWRPGMCESCETRPASTWCSGCIIEDREAGEIVRAEASYDPSTVDPHKAVVSRVVYEQTCADLRQACAERDSLRDSNQKASRLREIAKEMLEAHKSGGCLPGSAKWLDLEAALSGTTPPHRKPTREEVIAWSLQGDGYVPEDGILAGGPIPNSVDWKKEAEEWRHVAHYFLGDDIDTLTATEARALAVQRSIEHGRENTASSQKYIDRIAHLEMAIRTAIPWFKRFAPRTQSQGYNDEYQGVITKLESVLLSNIAYSSPPKPAKDSEYTPLTVDEADRIDRAWKTCNERGQLGTLIGTVGKIITERIDMLRLNLPSIDKKCRICKEKDPTVCDACEHQNQDKVEEHCKAEAAKQRLSANEEFDRAEKWKVVNIKPDRGVLVDYDSGGGALWVPFAPIFTSAVEVWLDTKVADLLAKVKALVASDRMPGASLPPEAIERWREVHAAIRALDSSIVCGDDACAAGACDVHAKVSADTERARNAVRLYNEASDKVSFMIGLLSLVKI